MNKELREIIEWAKYSSWKMMFLCLFGGLIFGSTDAKGNVQRGTPYAWLQYKKGNFLHTLDIDETNMLKTVLLLTLSIYIVYFFIVWYKYRRKVAETMHKDK